MQIRRPRPIVLIVLVLVPLIVAAAALRLLNRAPPELVLGPVVDTRDGAIQGAIVDDVAVYRGVPFANPPLGDLRWRAPQPLEPRTEVLRATEFKPACMQIGPPIPGMKTEPISEDCLYLNLWVPHPHPAKPLPVMVFLYGGSGMNGSASARFYWGNALARRGVITVNVSYRVGILGWLAHPELSQEASYRASGNYAVLDMIAGLRWVRDNIAAFGGDPNNVTLFGQSAGAFNASRLMASPLANGLIHKVIGQSGGDFYPAGTVEGAALLAQAERAGVEFANSVGAATIAELRRIPAEQIIAAPLPRSLTRLPIVDQYVAAADNQDLYRQGKQHKIPILVGYNALEGANLGHVLPPTNAREFIEHMKNTYGDLAARALELYPAGTDEEARRSFIRSTGERAINWNVATWARLHAATGESSVYVYHFSKPPPFGPLRRIGAAHGAELPYVFGFAPAWMRMFTQWPWNARQDLALAEQIPAYWTNFAKTGDPNAPGLPEWPAYSRTSLVMNFGATETGAVPMPDSIEHSFFDAYVQSLRHVGKDTHEAAQ